MLNILRSVLPIIVLVLAVYALIFGYNIVMPYMMFFMGAMVLVIGIGEIKEGRKPMGIIGIIVSAYVFYVSVKIFLFT